MYELAVLALLGLVTLKLSDMVGEGSPATARYRTLVTLALGVGTVFALDHSLFAGFAIPVREEWLGTLTTGLAVGALAGAWSALLGWLERQRDGAADRSGAGRPRIAA